MSNPNPHHVWLTELRHLNIRLSGGLDDLQPGTVPSLKQQIRELQNQIIDTPPTDRAGVLTQVELLKDMAWADAVRRLACSIGQGIEKLWPTTEGRE